MAQLLWLVSLADKTGHDMVRGSLQTISWGLGNGMSMARKIKLVGKPLWSPPALPLTTASPGGTLLHNRSCI